jgi:hypothetical protein
MIRINPRQVEWLVFNQPETEHDIQDPHDLRGEFQTCNDFWGVDIDFAKEGAFEYYLTPETYNALPQTFKSLKDDSN